MTLENSLIFVRVDLLLVRLVGYCCESAAVTKDVVSLAVTSLTATRISMRTRIPSWSFLVRAFSHFPVIYREQLVNSNRLMIIICGTGETPSFCFG